MRTDQTTNLNFKNKPNHFKALLVATRRFRYIDRLFDEKRLRGLLSSLKRGALIRRPGLGFILVFSCGLAASAQTPGSLERVKLSYVGEGWANNSVNAVIFRKNSLVTWQDTQFIAYYDKDRRVVLGKRRVGESHWEIRPTQHKGNAADAHNSISIMVDGDGYLHMSWDHHGHVLRYCRSLAPGSLELTEKMSMTGKVEQSVTYPEFYKLADGNLLFLYRNGASGRGDLVINRYETATRTWTQLHQNLIDGEGKRNA
uniref:BNR repeat-containing protein n=1 Tax=Arcticibacter sp. TaxID=1872630 RepID=UPI003891155A